ncbi:hypothetical protein EWB00_007109 [Schistosoma japonicum]|uniref:Uncharacterized protein n=1 Tax=Schistosoma japonicum TaxID=6182 RepID=A0A4Z2CW53_SCHJA|nr:hypothetical protein EWB00_007109 [Schistosoma japonicum]
MFFVAFMELVREEAEEGDHDYVIIDLQLSSLKLSLSEAISKKTDTLSCDRNVPSKTISGDQSLNDRKLSTPSYLSLSSNQNSYNTKDKEFGIKLPKTEFQTREELVTCIEELRKLCLLPYVEHRQPTSILQPTLSCAFLSSSSQVLFISVSKSRRNVFLSLPLFLWPSGFQVDMLASQLSRVRQMLSEERERRLAVEAELISSGGFKYQSNECFTYHNYDDDDGFDENRPCIFTDLPEFRCLNGNTEVVRSVETESSHESLPESKPNQGI